MNIDSYAEIEAFHFLNDNIWIYMRVIIVRKKNDEFLLLLKSLYRLQGLTD